MDIALAGAGSFELCRNTGIGAAAFTTLGEASGRSFDLLALCRGCEVIGAYGVSARCLLLPGDSAPRFTREIHAQQLIGYGFSPRDTLTLSSFGGSDRLLCLQRSVFTLDGTLLEPLELPLRPRLSGLSDESALLAGGVLLLCSSVLL